MAPPDSLNLDSSEDRTVRALVFVFWIDDSIVDLNSVRDARKDFLSGVLLVVEIRKLEQAHYINVGLIYLILAKVLLNLLHEL